MAEAHPDILRDPLLLGVHTRPTNPRQDWEAQHSGVSGLAASLAGYITVAHELTLRNEQWTARRPPFSNTALLAPEGTDPALVERIRRGLRHAWTDYLDVQMTTFGTTEAEFVRRAGAIVVPEADIIPEDLT
jgi:hypothetical protein